MVRKSTRTRCREDFESSSREATIADVDRMDEAAAKHGLLFEDFDDFEAWEAEQQKLTAYVRNGLILS